MKKIMGLAFVLALALLLAGCASPENSAEKRAGDKISLANISEISRIDNSSTTEKNISYFSYGIMVKGIECTPKNADENTPAIVVSGGNGADLKQLKAVCGEFAKEGIIALAHENVNGTVGDNIGAIVSAVEWLQKNQSGRKVSLWGHSAGTITSFFAAYEKPEVRAFIETSGHMQFMICDSETANNSDRQCAAYLDEFPAPILVVHGLNDTVVPPQFAYVFAQRMDGLKKPYEIFMVPDAAHEFMDERKGVIEKEAEFVRKYSK